MITERRLSFSDLRKIVVALHDAYMFLKQDHLTFAHGNIGNEFHDLAKYLDEFVADLEPRHVLLLQREVDIEQDKIRMDELYNDRESAHNQLIAIRELLGLRSVSEIPEKIKEMQQKLNKKK